MASYKTTVSSRSLSHNHSIITSRNAPSEAATGAPTGNPCAPRRDSDNIPREMSTAETAVQCCCGRPGCAYLEHNTRALGDLERDLDQAAKLGQALLQRHESYLAESSADRLRLNGTISTLEHEKEQVQARNNALVAENRALLDDLERVNNEVGLADGKISSMTAMLAEAQFEVRRLNGMAKRAEELENELAQYDQRQHALEREVEDTQKAEKSAIGRWKDAERRTRDLNEQVERIEREARHERETHAELVGRMERRRKVEQELEVAAGRLKGAAAVATAAQDPGGGRSKVVSHFVRDILQDNANLQAGLTELRELLQSSNEEVQNLREQVIGHQPVSSPQGDGDETVTTPLNEELEWAASSRQVSQEVHVHHHYHAKFAAKKAPLTRRGSKKRSSPGLLTPTPGSPMPLSPSTRHANLALSTSYQQPHKARWSVQSAATASSTVGSSTISSMPNSPPYYLNGGGSMFDRMEQDSESSRPTTPDSEAAEAYAGPRFGIVHRKGQPSDFSLNGFVVPEEDEVGSIRPGRTVFQEPDPMGSKTPASADHVPVLHTTDEEGPALDPLDNNAEHDSQPVNHQSENDVISPTSMTSIDPADDLDIEPAYFQNLQPSVLRRSTSHESLVSISGMDIHIPKQSPSQIFFGRRTFTPHPKTPKPCSSLPASQPLASTVEVNAGSSSQRSASDSASSILSGLVGPPQSHPSNRAAEPRGLSRLVGGWVRGKWGVAPIASTGDLRAQARQQRPMGINQSGPIPGLRGPVRTPTQVHARVLDQGLLKEALGE